MTEEPLDRAWPEAAFVSVPCLVGTGVLAVVLPVLSPYVFLAAGALGALILFVQARWFPVDSRRRLVSEMLPDADSARQTGEEEANEKHLPESLDPIRRRPRQLRGKGRRLPLSYRSVSRFAEAESVEGKFPHPSQLPPPPRRPAHARKRSRQGLRRS